ncbi:MAG: HAD family hydrolase [Phascolarctobacterium sp.]|nr:HAD family hydrolase [Phascolarctobacterium sp.]
MKAVFFDLDGTLLFVEIYAFMQEYTRKVTKKFSAKGYDPQVFTKKFWDASIALMQCDGSKLCSETFWDTWCQLFEKTDYTEDEKIFEDFYNNEWKELRELFIKYNPDAVRAVEICRKKGLKVVLATNPVFPPLATDQRMSWTGLAPEMFDYVTYYDNSHYTKSDTNYYLELCEKLDLKPEDVLMVGNDTRDDMNCIDVGLHGFLLTNEYCYDRGNIDIEKIPHGDFKQLLKYLENL